MSQHRRKTSPLPFAIYLAASASLCTIAAANLAHAQDSLDSNRAVSENTHSYSIEAGPLALILSQFAAASGVAISFDANKLGNRQSPGLNGQYSIEHGFRLLLKETELVAVKQPNGDYELQQQLNQSLTSDSQEAASDTSSPSPESIDAVTVFGRFQNDTVEDVPQSISILDEDDLDLGSANSVGDVLRLIHNTTRAGSSLDMFADDYLIRGFGAEQSTNGLSFTRTDHPTDLSNIERIEVLKGPASVLYGEMEPGGTINVVTKQPLPDFQADTGLEIGSFDHRRATLDVTGPFNNKVRGRLNLAYQESGSSVDFLESERLFLAPNITVDLSDRTNLTVEGSYSANDWTALHGGAPIEGSIVENPNGDYNRTFNPGYKDSFTERDSTSVNLRLTHELNDHLNARASYTFNRNESDFQEYGYFGLGEDFRTVDRIIFAANDTQRDDHDLILDLSGEFVSGSLTHKFLAGVEFREFDEHRPTQVYFVPSIDLYDPQHSTTDLDTEAVQVRDRTLKADNRVLAAFLQDRITMAESWHILGGLRYIDSQQSQININHMDDDSREKDKLDQSDWTTQLGVIYDLNDASSLYLSRSESFVPQGGTTAGAKPLDAEESVQLETGFRFQTEKWQAAVLAYVINKDNIAIEDPLDDNFEIAAGKARSKGAELSFSGNVTSNWYLSAAYGYTDTEILKSDDPELEGKRFANIPKNTFTLLSRYRLNAIPDLSLGGTLTYMSDRFGDDENSFELPSHTRVDLSAEYALSQSMQLIINIDNVFDEEIYSPGAYSGVVPEPERTYQAQLRYFF